MRVVGGVVAAAIAMLAAIVAWEGSGRAGQAATPVVPRFERVIVVVFENKDEDDVFGSGDAPTFDALARRYTRLTPYLASARPSLPNYIVMVAGHTGGLTTNCDRGEACVVEGKSIVDSLEAKGMTWKGYMEGLPSPGFLGVSSGRYARKHNPFAFFRNIVNNPQRRKRIVPYSQFKRDLARGKLPDYSMVIPHMCNGMHDCPVATGDAWLKREIVPLLSKRALRRSVIFVVFDEDSEAGQVENQRGGPIPGLVLGPLVKAGSRPGTLMTHPRLLRTIEQAWGLPYLGQSARVKPLSGIWKR